MKKLQLLLLMLFLSICVFGQVQNVDSLIYILETQEGTSLEQFELCRKIRNYYRQSDMDKFLQYARRGLSIAGKEKDRNTQYKMYDISYEELGLGYTLKGNYDTALIYFDKALEYADKINDTKIHSIYLHKGSVYYQQKKFNTTLEYLLKALSLCEKSGDRGAEVMILSNIGNVYNEIGDYDRSHIYYEKARAIVEENKIAQSKIFVYRDLGSVHIAKKEYQKALDYCLQIEELCKAENNKRFAIYNYMSLSTIYVDGFKEYDKANEYAEEALRLAMEFKDPVAIGYSYGTLAQSSLYLKKYKDADAYAQMAWDMDSTDVNNAFGLANIIAISNMYLNNKEKAAAFLEKIKDLREQQNKKDYHANLMNMEIRYETEKKELQIASLEKEKKLYTWLGIAGILFTVSLGVVLLQNIRNVKKEKQLIATQSVMDGEMSERTRLARDLHDRLGGNLSAVKIELNNAESLLNASDKLDSCIEEVRRVAHNLMPTSLQYGIKTALEDFAAQFPNVYFHFFGKDIRLDERTEFVLYCCANELVNNSLRHSGAQNVNLQLVQDDKHITLTVQDDGKGYDEKTEKKGLGLRNVYDRITSCNGKIDVVSSPDKGTETIIELKIK